MYKIRICLEVDGLAQDENRQPCPSGVQIEIGESEIEIPYDKPTSSVDITRVLQAACLDAIVDSGNAHFISPEEYDVDTENPGVYSYGKI